VAHILGDKDDKTVSCGIAVAPVTDFRYYGQSVQSINHAAFYPVLDGHCTSKL